MPKIVTQLSGGIESATLLAKAIAENGHENVFPISFDDASFIYLNKEAPSIKAISIHYNMQMKLYRCAAPHWDDLEFPTTPDFPVGGFMPGLKMFINMMSMAYAQKVGADEVWTGNMLDNHYGDEKPEYLRELEELYNKTYDSHIKLLSPLQSFTKSDVIQYATKLGVPLHKTISCEVEYYPGINCGKCPWCLKRREAFLKAGIKDETKYVGD